MSRNSKKQMKQIINKEQKSGKIRKKQYINGKRIYSFWDVM
jgi:hypothetical protein